LVETLDVREQLRGKILFRREPPATDDLRLHQRDTRFRFAIEPTRVPEGFYFALGDNSRDSFDSRYWGFVDEKDIIGVPYLRVWPVPRFGPM
jgi:signal peptidase I